MANRHDMGSGGACGLLSGPVAKAAATAALMLVGLGLLSPLGAGQAALVAFGAALALALGRRLRPAAPFAARRAVKVDGGAVPPVVFLARRAAPRRPMVLDGGSLEHRLLAARA
ncbi:hypothetical protein [Thiococcus pfennigii]|uniref:hypothetical protein n=1 Tax=Thiococcus pfennigii TaxID=1057 RepID=UPI001908A62E|nr:hypothetical protein [Thiococcus pfennigii]